MIASNPLPREFAGELAHLERQQKALLPRHGALNLKLESLRRRAGVANRHAQMLPRYCAWQFGQVHVRANISRSVAETSAAVFADTAPSIRTNRCRSTARNWSNATCPRFP